MAIIDNPVFEEILGIFDDGQKPIKNTWKCEIHVDTLEEPIQPFRIISMDRLRKYNENISDEIQLTVLIPQGIYDFDIFPNRENIEVTLFKVPLSEVNSEEPDDVDVKIQRYRAQLYDRESTHIGQKAPSHTSKENANLRELKELTLQLLDLPIEQIRLMSVGGIFRDTNTANVIRLVLGKQSKQVNVDDTYSVKGVDIAEGFDPKIWKHVIIPHHTKLQGLATYVQEHGGGVYSSGIGMYLQDNIWYVFPPYNIKRFETAINTVTVLNVPSNLMPGVERTYRKQGEQLFIISTGDVKHNDFSDEHQQNYGNGIRYLIADNTVEGFASVSDNKATAVRSSNNVEAKIHSRKTKMDFISLSDKRATSNHADQYSRLAVRNGAYIQFIWENADVSLLKPGMGARFIYPVGETLKEVYGCVYSVQALTESKGGTSISGPYITTAAVMLFVQRNDVNV